MIRVLALDLSLTSTGVAHPDGAVETWQVKLLSTDRLLALRSKLLDAVRDNDITIVVIEGYAFNRPHQACHLGELGGVVRVTLHEAGVRWVDVPPANLKKYATGRGNAGKEEMLTAAVRRLGYAGHSNDEADALWLRAMTLDHYGEATVTMPAVNRGTLAKVAWPELAAS